MNVENMAIEPSRPVEALTDGMSERQRQWASTMLGATPVAGLVYAHKDSAPPSIEPRVMRREDREALEDATLAKGATRARGAGDRANAEEPDSVRTCFERDRDRILHSTSFRRLAGKTQVFVFPGDHQRTRLTHALEVAQVATSIARAVGLNVALTEAIALGHDCGHGPGGHASEDAFDPYIPEGYHHAVWGADVVLQPLNLCAETLDGIRNHSWSRPTPMTPEGAVVSWADRYAYCAHDLEDAIAAGIVSLDEIPASVSGSLGATRSQQLRTLISASVLCIEQTGQVGLDVSNAQALSDLRAFNYERIYTRPASNAQGQAVIDILRALVDHFVARPELLGHNDVRDSDIPRRAVTYVAGMTDRYAFETAVSLLGWPKDRLPQGIDSPVRLG